MSDLHDISWYYQMHRYQGNLLVDQAYVYFISDRGGNFAIWRQLRRGGAPEAVTHLDASYSVQAMAADFSHGLLYFLADRLGRETCALYRLHLSSGRLVTLQEGGSVRREMHEFCLSPDRRSLALSANDRDPEAMDVLVCRDVQGPAPTFQRIWSDGGYWSFGRWNVDGSGVVLVEIRSNTCQRLHYLDMRSGVVRPLTPDWDGVAMPVTFVDQGRRLLMVSDVGSEFFNLIPMAIDDSVDGLGREGTGTTLQDRPSPSLETAIVQAEWNVEAALSAGDGKLLWVLNQDGQSVGYWADSWRNARDGGGKRLDFPQGTFEAWELSPEEDHLYATWNHPRLGRGIWRASLATGEVEPFVAQNELETSPAPSWTLDRVRYQAPDGLFISALYYRPAGLGPFPVVVVLHGGPEDQERPRYVGIYQFLLSRGIGVFAPNFRGSTGYGRSFQRRVYRDWGGAELEDIMAGVRWLGSQAEVDSRRLAVMGGSFGGFATLSAISRYPQYWRAAVDMMGPVNLQTFVSAVPPTWRQFMAEWIGDPEKDAEFLWERSPLTHAAHIQCPLLVVQGAHDPRVPASESQQLLAELRPMNLDVEVYWLDDEGHGFNRRENQLEVWQRVSQFLMSHLLAEA